jgi:hypothetical protein
MNVYSDFTIPVSGVMSQYNFHRNPHLQLLSIKSQIYLNMGADGGIYPLWAKVEATTL